MIIIIIIIIITIEYINNNILDIFVIITIKTSWPLHLQIQEKFLNSSVNVENIYKESKLFVHI